MVEFGIPNNHHHNSNIILPLFFGFFMLDVWIFGRFWASLPAGQNSIAWEFFPEFISGEDRRSLSRVASLIIIFCSC